MQVCILHHHSHDVKGLEQALEARNIQSKKSSWNDDIILNAASLWDCDAVIVCLNNSLVPNALREIRKIHENLPILVVDFSKNWISITEKVCMKSGANAYLRFPVLVREIELMIKKLLMEREPLQNNKWIRVFDVNLDPSRHIVKRKEKIIPLRNKEFSLLEFFAINRGKVLTRDTILEFVWDRNGTFASNTVDVHVNRLRRKLDDPFKDKLIHTVHCVGYVFEKRDNDFSDN